MHGPGIWRGGAGQRGLEGPEGSESSKGTSHTGEVMKVHVGRLCVRISMHSHRGRLLCCPFRYSSKSTCGRFRSRLESSSSATRPRSSCRPSRGTWWTAASSQPCCTGLTSRPPSSSRSSLTSVSQGLERTLCLRRRWFYEGAGASPTSNRCIFVG